jgi:hypothetical protein
MSKTPETDALLKQCEIKGRNPDPWKLCRNLERRLNAATKSLKFIAKEGGKVVQSEYGEISCNGIWCSDQALSAIYDLEDLK